MDGRQRQERHRVQREYQIVNQVVNGPSRGLQEGSVVLEDRVPCPGDSPVQMHVGI